MQKRSKLRFYGLIFFVQTLLATSPPGLDAAEGGCPMRQGPCYILLSGSNHSPTVID